MLTPAARAALTSELTADPAAIGYAAHYPPPEGDGDCAALAALLNAADPTLTDPAFALVPLETVPADVLRRLITAAELDDLATDAAHYRYLVTFLLGSETVASGDASVRAEVRAILLAHTLLSTRSDPAVPCLHERIVAATTRRRTRAETVLGDGVTLTPADVARCFATLRVVQPDGSITEKAIA